MKIRLNVLFLIILSFCFIITACGGDDSEPDPTPPDPGGTFERLKKSIDFKSTILNYTLKYSILLPEGYDKSDKTYPVVYLLHGYGDDENAWINGGNIKYHADKATNGGILGDAIFVMPQGFNSYYVNKFDNSYNYMKMFTDELVPFIDKEYRTKKDKSQRAIIGYSMGGYGSFILPTLNPTIFSNAVSLSMSWRTDKQYLAEPQNVFDMQFGNIFGGAGSSGNGRITEYFKTMSPFHFFAQADISKYKGVKYFLDCGDDEEQLSITNDALHALMREKNIPHEYRMRNGAHTWGYWTENLEEIFAFLNASFMSSSFPQESPNASVHPQDLKGTYQEISINGLTGKGGIYLPEGYATSGLHYPVIYFIHDRKSGTIDASIKSVLSLLEDAIKTGVLPKLIVAELPVSSIQDETFFSKVIENIDANYATIAQKSARLVMANNKGGKYAEQSLAFVNGCSLFSAELPVSGVSLTSKFYYLDITDDAAPYTVYKNMYENLREEGVAHEYRVRNGTDSYQSFLNGVSESFNYINEYIDKPVK